MAMVWRTLHSFIALWVICPSVSLPKRPSSKMGALGPTSGVESQLLHSVAVCPWTCYLTSLCLNFLLYKMT